MHTLSRGENPENFTYCEPPERLLIVNIPENFISRWGVCARPAGRPGLVLSRLPQRRGESKEMP